jgi:hypothetical protein
MGHSDLDPAARELRPWNAAQIVGAKRPLKPRDVWAELFGKRPRDQDHPLFHSWEYLH